ncbi:MAG TPA: YihY/virulence factor BrkB family protein [Dehalococcoidia bacterium]|nr:YihY/virulence factor BrkB family protein [Dehalococcoidia bacterium]
MAAILDRLRVPEVRVGRFDLTRIVRDTVREVGDDDVPGLAAEMAYHAILAVFPFLLFLAGLTSIINHFVGVGDVTQRMVDRAGDVLPDDATSLLRSFTDSVVYSRGGPAFAFGLLGSLWASSAAIGTAMKALNRAYDAREERSFLRRKAVALGLTVTFSALIIAASALLATGGLMAGGIGRAFGWDDQFVRLWNWLSFPIALALVTLAVAILYWRAPSAKHSFAWITPGSLLFVVGWVGASLAFVAYIANFGSYNKTYGSIAAVIILMVWFYWSSLLLLVGGEVNAVLARRHDDEFRRAEGATSRAGAGSRAQP